MHVLADSPSLLISLFIEASASFRAVCRCVGTVLLALLSLTGCAAGHLGLVAARCTRTGSAYVIECRAFGPEIQWGRGGWWMGAGFRRSVEIHSRPALENADSAWVPWDGWRYLFIPLPEASPMKHISNVTGAGFHFDAGGSGLEIGYSQRMLTVAPMGGKGVAWEIHYDSHNPSETRAIIHNHE